MSRLILFLREMFHSYPFLASTQRINAALNQTFAETLLQHFYCQCGELFSQGEVFLNQNHFYWVLCCESRAAVKYVSENLN